MTVLSAQSIRERIGRDDESRIGIEPFTPAAVGPHNLDVRLGYELLVWVPFNRGLDFGDGVFQTLGSTGYGWHLKPGRFYLGATLERVELPRDLRAQLDGCSTEARRSLVIHQTGGSVDAGWRGHLTLELTVTIPQWLMPGARIGQLTFQALDAPTDTPYRGRYQADAHPTPPKEARP